LDKKEKQFNEGDQKGDMGLKAKQITNMMRVIMAKIANMPIGLVATKPNTCGVYSTRLHSPPG
jgi:hypothetical protein